MKIISFEGVEASGKSTQINILEKYLRSKNFKVEISREPGGCKISEQIRDILLNKDNISMTGKCELFLYLASRTQHYSELIESKSKQLDFLLLDRFTDSTLAYQGFGRGLEIGFLKQLNDFAINDSYPQLTFIFDISIKSLKDRLNVRKRELDRLEKEEIGFHIKVKNGYIEISKQNERYIMINGDKDIDGISKEIIHFVYDKFDLKN